MAEYWFDFKTLNPNTGWPAEAIHEWDADQITTSVKADPFIVKFKGGAIWRRLLLGKAQGVTTLHLFLRHLEPALRSFINTGCGVFFRAETLTELAEDGYYASVGSSTGLSSSNRYFAVNRRNGGESQTLLGSIEGGGLHQYGVGRHLKVQLDGNTIRIKAWEPTEEEPAIWESEVNDAVWAGDYYGLMLQAEGNMVMFDYLAVGTNGDSPPTGPVNTKPPGLGQQIEGNATKAAGAAVDAVNVFIWPQGPIVDSVAPDSNGDWQAYAPVVNYGVTYIAEGCQPITHGPYMVDAAQ